MEPVFPVEILGHIIDIFCEEQSRQHKPNLGSCTLTCNLFASICRPYTFRHIFLGRPILGRGVLKRRLFRLIDLFDSQPDLKGYVRELTLVTTAFRGGEFNPTESQRCWASLSSFSNLQTLSILCMPSRYAFCDNWLRCTYYLLRDYLRQESLQSLDVDSSSATLSAAILLSGPHLQHLRIKGWTTVPFGPQPASKPLPTSNIGSLDIAHENQFPLSTLLALPSLEKLSFTAFVHEEQETTIDQREPSFRLKELCLAFRNSNGAQMQQFVDFYLNHAQRCGKPPFSCLEALDITAVTNEDLPPIRDMLNQEFRLKSFRFETMPSETLSFPISKLIPSLSRKLATCTTVEFQITATHDEYESTVVSLSNIVSSLAGHNVLEFLKLELKCSIVGDSHPDPWAPLRHILTTATSFPDLRDVMIDDSTILIERQRVDVENSF